MPGFPRRIGRGGHDNRANFFVVAQDMRGGPVAGFRFGPREKKRRTSAKRDTTNANLLPVMPAKFYAPTGIAMTPMLATVAQAHGSTLIVLAVIDVLARSADSHGVRAVLAGNFVA
jgi:hypothetical protein